MFLNFKTTFSSNFFGLGSIAAIIILLPKYLCTKRFENEPEWDTNMVVYKNGSSGDDTKLFAYLSRYSLRREDNASRRYAADKC